MDEGNVTGLKKGALPGLFLECGWTDVREKSMADERCVVCGLTANPKIVVTHKGKQYKMCCYRCKKRFEQIPEQYIE